MKEHSVTQADLMTNDKESSKARYGGESNVRVDKVAGVSNKIKLETFAMKLSWAMCVFFEYFTTYVDTHIKGTFYGIAENAMAAGSAFKMTHNLVEWACAYKGGTPSFSYSLGVADGLVAMANLEKERELEGVRLKELEFKAAERSNQSSRELSSSEKGVTAPLTQLHNVLDAVLGRIALSNHEDSGSDCGGHGVTDFRVEDARNIRFEEVDAAIDRLVNHEPVGSSALTHVPLATTATEAEVKTQDQSPTPAPSLWKSERQLVQFRANSERVADDYFKERNITLSNGNRKRPMVRDHDAYGQGWKDSGKINVKEGTWQ
ncbi:Uncharacterized protein PECH_002228 [Penicillium ucsense]|uniref:DUF7168 domain-containing protein n=1 Tax=Penicillium ucsense TaxID=2839758 RepID=A0A8J8VXA9_9EURO|nr:Uncharacterized protein PECM_001397 [Penicillium ucsense]KAF7731146.1 Uncharacterized protein PECH_002228 [Penicillium ucsense]